MSRVPLGFAACLAVLFAPGVAAGRPVVGGAVPLSILSLPSAANVPDAEICPSAGGFDGTGNAAALRDALREQDRALPSWMFDIVVAKQAVLVCDPDAARAERFLPALSGDVAQANRDWAWFGLRGLQLSPTDGQPAGLRVGDQVQLPAGGPKTAVDLSVAAGEGVRSTRVPAGATPVRIQISGPSATPIAEVTRADGSVWRWSVGPVRAVRLTTKVRPLRRDHVLVSGSTTPGALVHLATKRSRTVIADEHGRFSVDLKLPKKRSTLVVAAIDRPSRTQAVRNCTVRWDAARNAHRSATCRTNVKHERIGDVSGTRSGQPSRRWRSTPAMAQRLTAVPKGSLAETALTVAGAGRSWSSWVEPAAGDLNGDGRPDFTIFDPGRQGSSIRLSRGSGWVTVRVDRSSSSLTTYPDLTGDGRAEIEGDGQAIITDAFGGAAPPTKLDLSKQRQMSPTDLVPPSVHTDPLAVDSSMFTWFRPIGTLPDVTGDGRREIVSGQGLPMVVASDDLRPGVRMNAANVTEVSTLGDLQFPQALAPGEGPHLVVSDETIEWESARDWPEFIARGGTLTSVGPVDRAQSPAETRPFEIAEFDARGQRSGVRTFTASGVTQLLDVDPSSGEVLVRLLASKPCRYGVVTRGKRAICPERILRIDRSGTIAATIAVSRTADAPFAAFVADGSDPDTALEVVVSSSETYGATPCLIGSSQRGTIDSATAPVLATGGKPISRLHGLKVVVLENGSRWLTATRSRNFDFDIRSEPPPDDIVVLQPR